MNKKIKKVFDFEMLIDSNDCGVSLSLDRYGTYENEDIELAKREIDKNSTFIDIGAHIGVYSIALARYLKDSGKVISFEPSSHNFSILEENVKLNNCNNIILNKNAVFNKEMEIDLYINEFNTGDNRIYYPGVKRKTEKINTVTIDNYLKRNKEINNISLIKIDTQGVELAVLKGCENTLKKYYPKIIFEYWPKGIKEFGNNEEDLLNFIMNLGYKIYRKGKEFKYDKNEKIDYINLFSKIN